MGVASICTILFLTTGCSTAESKTETVPSESSQNCTPGYHPCLLQVNDYDNDCEGGTGDGPLFAPRVKVFGNDLYQLDSNGDGIGCSSSSIN